MKFRGKHIYFINAILIFSIIIILSCNRKPAGYQYPDLNNIPPGASGDSIKYGKEIISNTSIYIGPEVNDVSKRFSGNNLACQNCHINAGREPNSLGFVGVYLFYPEYDTRVDSVIMIQQRVNECMRRSMNGKPMPPDSYEMKCIIAYFKWISSEITNKNAKKYEGLPKLQFLTRAADTSKGRIVYTDKCMSCHAENGAGGYNKGIPKLGFNIPALWGNDTYNNGAGMYRLITAAEFIKSKMPFTNADLSDEEAWDVAAYINSKPHPEKVDLEKDFPDLGKKPVDCPYPPYADSFSVFQHKYGPYDVKIK